MYIVHGLIDCRVVHFITRTLLSSCCILATKVRTSACIHVTCFSMANDVQWIDAYPEAKSYVCPGGMKKFPDITYTQVSAWSGHEVYMHSLTLQSSTY